MSSVRLLEECFVTKDPFTPDKEKFLVLGSTCNLCGMRVCVGSVRRPVVELLYHGLFSVQTIYSMRSNKLGQFSRAPTGTDDRFDKRV